MSRASRTAAVAGPDEAPRPAPQRSTMLERFGLLARLLVRFAFAQRARASRARRARPPAVDAGHRDLRDAVPLDDRLSAGERGAAARGPAARALRARRVDDVVAADPARSRGSCCDAARRPASRPTRGVRRSSWPRASRCCSSCAARPSPDGAAARWPRRGSARSSCARSCAPRARRRGRSFLVPLAIFRGTGFRKRESRFATLLYSVQEAPGEAKRLFTYLWNAGQTQLTPRQEIALRRFVDEHRRRGRGAHRAPAGARPADRPLPRGADRAGADAAASPRRCARWCCATPSWCGSRAVSPRERGVPRRKVVKEARGYVDEMAAHFNGLYFGDPRVPLQPHLAARLLGARDRRPRARRRAHEASIRSCSCRATAATSTT